MTYDPNPQLCGATDSFFRQATCQVEGPHTDGMHHWTSPENPDSGYHWQVQASKLGSSEVARGHVVQGIGGHTPRTITELSAKELADVFDNEDTQRDIGAAYVSESDNDITLDGTWNVSDLLTALAAKLAEEG